MKLIEYLPFVVGCLAGLALAFLVTSAIDIADPGRLLVFGLLPALSGGVVERLRKKP